jgi:hypothetical protein
LKTRATFNISFVVVFLFTIIGAFMQEAGSAVILWSSSHEAGDLSDWYRNQSGAVYNTGGKDARVSVTDEIAYTGKYSVKMEVWNIDRELRACRIFRWAEKLTEGYYSCWFMFPILPQVDGWLNIFQFKKHDYIDQGGTGRIDPTWYHEVKSTRQGTVLTLTHWQKDWNVSPHSHNLPKIRAKKWFHVEWHYKDGINDGIITIWINGKKYWSLHGVDTRGVHPAIQWAPSLYGVNVSPGHLVLYMDDAVISTERVGPSYFNSGAHQNNTGGGETKESDASISGFPELNRKGFQLR